MLREYPLESPPALPPLDDEWAGAPLPVHTGRRVRPLADGFDLGGGIALTTIATTAAAERCLCALEEPCVVWEGEGGGAVTLTAQLTFPDAEVHAERSGDGARLLLSGERGPAELLLGAIGGTLQIEEVNGRLTLTASGAGKLRLVAVSAFDEADRGRTLRALARKGVKGLLDQRRRHLEQLAGLGVALSTPEPGHGALVEALKVELDGHLRELEGGRRTLPDPSYIGAVLLTLGLREPVRDVLRGPIDSAELVMLFARYAEWAGADEFVTKHWPRALAEARQLNRRAWLPIAEAVGDRVAIAELVDGGPLDAEPGPDPIEELFSPRANALDGVVHLAPSLPAGWPEMTLTRLRVGPTTLDVRVRRRPAGIAVKVRVTHGPRLVVRLAPRLERPATGVLLGGEQLAGPEICLTLETEEEGVWMV